MIKGQARQTSRVTDPAIYQYLNLQSTISKRTQFVIMLLFDSSVPFL